MTNLNNFPVIAVFDIICIIFFIFVIFSYSTIHNYVVNVVKVIFNQ